jgi:hypothetical protein
MVLPMLLKRGGPKNNGETGDLESHLDSYMKNKIEHYNQMFSRIEPQLINSFYENLQYSLENIFYSSVNNSSFLRDNISLNLSAFYKETPADKNLDYLGNSDPEFMRHINANEKYKLPDSRALFS